MRHFNMVRRHRVRWALAVVVAGIAAGATAANAVQPDGSFSGTSAPGAHEWIQDLEGTQFCANCHAGIAADLEAGPHSSAVRSVCVVCHPPSFDGGNGHAAQRARCADCHGYSSPGEPHVGSPLSCDTCHVVHGPLYGGAVEQLKNDVHAGIRDDLGEFDDAEVSKTCLACHTHVAITIDTTTSGPLELIMGD